MIVDLLSNAGQYTHLHPGIAAGFTYLASGTWKTLPPGKHLVDGERLWVLREGGAGRGENARLEAHKRYIDIHVCDEGTDVIGWRAVSTCSKIEKPYSDAHDVGLWKDRPELRMDITGERFAVFFPGDAHAPFSGTEPLKKIVVKVAIDW